MLEINSKDYRVGFVLGIFTALLLGTLILLLLSFWKTNEPQILEIDETAAKRQETELKEYVLQTRPELYLDLLADCPESELSVSDRYACLSALAKDKENSARMLEAEITSLAHQGILNSENKKMLWEPGGQIFLQELPKRIEATSKSADVYIQDYCELDQMKLQGGSGMDLEREACKIELFEDYLELLETLRTFISS